MDCSPPASSVHGILQARRCRLPCPSPGDLPDPGIKPASHCFLHWQAGSLPPARPGKPWRSGDGQRAVKALVTQSCPTLCDPMNSSSPGSSVHRNFQARVLEWVFIPFSRGSLIPGIWFDLQGSNPGLLHCRQILCHLSHQGSLRLEQFPFPGPRVHHQRGCRQSCQQALLWAGLLSQKAVGWMALLLLL